MPQIDYDALAAQHGGVPGAAAPDDKPLTAQRPTLVQRMQANQVREEAGLPSNFVSDKTREKLNTPLAHPTGVDVLDNQTSPMGIAMLAAYGIKPASAAAYKAVMGLVSSTEPEIAREIVGLLSPRAGAGLKLVERLAAKMRGAAPEGAAPAAEGAPVEAAPVQATATPPPPAAPPAEVPAPATARPSGSALPDQRALNESALAARRATYQASQGGSAAPAAATPQAAGKITLTAPESRVLMELTRRGMKGGEALKAILDQRELAAKLRTPSGLEVSASVAERNATGKWNR